MDELSQAAQDYLKTIYCITENGARATTNQLAEEMAVKPASVTGMMQKMAKCQPPLVSYKKHQGVTLTAVGKQAALEMIRRHRLIESFLHEKLGYNWDEVHEEADRLEHVVSEEMEARMAATLSHPERDPHGHPIPSIDLETAPATEFPLIELEVGQTAVIRRVCDNDPEILRWLARHNLRPGTELRLNAIIPEGSLLIQSNNQQIDLLLPIAEILFVDLGKRHFQLVAKGSQTCQIQIQPN
ncbi:MAG: metal-dependent transcriptional regulator [Aquificales bacterium]|nr:metal-dependent transcriptional regulator [Aquificales bacterium]